MDILGITDEDTWDYGEALKDMIQEKGLQYVKFTRCMNLLGLIHDENMTREEYLATAATCRQVLEQQFGRSDDELTKLIKVDEATNTTYCDMIKFLRSEMETSPSLDGLTNAAKIRLYKNIGKKMMQRSEALTLAIRMRRPYHVRLSMHPSSGVAKLSIALNPGPDGAFQKSP